MISERLVSPAICYLPSGTLYLHCDWHVNHLIRQQLDEIFGADAFVNEIVWHYFGFKHDKRREILPRKHDTILVYSKSEEHVWNVQYTAPSTGIRCAFQKGQDRPIV